MNLLAVVDNTLSHVRLYLDQLGEDRYCQSLEVFSGSSIGQHTRHIIEFLDCLSVQCDSGLINYDQRLRNKLIEEQPAVAATVLEAVLDRLYTHELKKKLTLAFTYDCETDSFDTVDTTFERELVYNIEHAIHHLAIIKIGLKEIAPDIQLPVDFGVAPSTIRYHSRADA